MEASPPSGMPLWRKLAFLSLAMYLSSVALPCLYVSGRVFGGGELLVMGWVGPFFGAFAWYANPFYWYALKKAFRRDTQPVGSPMVATIFALTVLLTGVPVNEAHGPRPIDGYGIGYVLWLLSMPLLFASTHAKMLEGTQEQVGFRDLLRKGPSVFFFALLAGVVLLAVGQRLTASAASRKMLAKAVIMQHNFSTKENPTPKCRIPLTGPLEIAGPNSNNQVPASLSDPQILLSWGIPVVRRDGYDFSLRNPADATSMEAVKAKGEPAAILRIGLLGDTVTGRLSSWDGTLEAFDTTWKCNGILAYSPELNYYSPKPDEPPRSLVMASLALPANPIPASSNNDKSYTNRYPVKKLVAANIKEEAMRPAYEAAFEYSKSECDANPQLGVKVGPRAHPVRTRDVYRFIDHPSPKIFCEGENAYIYFVRSYTLILHRRSMDDFRPLWDAIVEVQADAIHDLGGFKVEEMQPVQITEQGRKLHVTMGFKTVPPYTGFTGLHSFDVDLSGVGVSDQSNPRTSP